MTERRIELTSAWLRWRRCVITMHTRTDGLQSDRVANLTADELQARCGKLVSQSPVAKSSSPDQGFAGETVPLLQEVFKLFENSGWLYLEMKADAGAGAELAAEVVRIIRQSPVRSRVVVECFDLSLIERVKAIDVSIRTAALFEPRLSKPTTMLPRNLAELAQAAGVRNCFASSLARVVIVEKALR